MCIAVTNGARHTRSLRALVEAVRRDVQAVIDHDGAFITTGDLAAFICR